MHPNETYGINFWEVSALCRYQCPPGWLLFFGSSKTFQLASWEWKHPYRVDQSFHTPRAEFSINPRKRDNWMTQVFWFFLANSHSIISWGGGKWGKHPNFEDKWSPKNNPTNWTWPNFESQSLPSSFCQQMTLQKEFAWNYVPGVYCWWLKFTS